tara:strand:- start:404 stop:1546 length:1143 start_codon:yes stop_codon:yes gene_type:complete
MTLMQRKKWENFKDHMPYKTGDFAKRNWGSQLHSLCSYQGKIKPSIAYHLIDVFTKRGDVVSDPFSGSGTIPLEATIAGRIPVASDLSDMAVAISNAKIGITSNQCCEKIINDLEEWIANKKISEKTKRDAEDVAFNKNIAEYFEQDTFHSILKARDYFIKSKALNDGNWCLVFSSMLHILHGNRPYALSRKSHPLTPYAPSGDFIKKDLIKHLKTKSFDSLRYKSHLPIGEEFEINQADVLELSKSQKRIADCIITSPPFASSTRFYMTNWMRFWFSGWGIEDFNNSKKIFIESKKKEGMNIYQDVFKELKHTLKPGGLLVLHVGKNSKVDMGARLAEIDFPDFAFIDQFTESVVLNEKHGIKDKGSTTAHQYLVYENS